MSLMYDSTTLDAIPPDAPAVAGYVNGSWPTYPEVCRRWPSAKHLSIAVSSDADAECADIEKGDFPIDRPDIQSAWFKRQSARGVVRPVFYTSVSQVKTLLDGLAPLGIKRSDMRLWTAHYGQGEHLCSLACWEGMPTTADATQWNNRALGRNLDQSLLSDSFFPPPQPPPQAQAASTPKEDSMHMHASVSTAAVPASGNGWIDVVPPVGYVVTSVILNGADALDGQKLPDATFAARDIGGGKWRINFSGLTGGCDLYVGLG